MEIKPSVWLYRLLGLILAFKDKVVKGFKTLYDYLVSLFR